MNLGDEERRAYEYYLEDLHYQASLHQSSSYVEGKEEGSKKGAKAKATKMARAMKQKGISLTDIAEISGLPREEIEKL